MELETIITGILSGEFNHEIYFLRFLAFRRYGLKDFIGSLHN